jgi:hypothetical protein
MRKNLTTGIRGAFHALVIALVVLILSIGE